jgi:hypothetical protein
MASSTSRADGRTASDDLPDPEARQLKAQFESAAGPDYVVGLAYGPPYQLARRLVQFAVGGARSDEDYLQRSWGYASRPGRLLCIDHGIIFLQDVITIPGE